MRMIIPIVLPAALIVAISGAAGQGRADQRASRPPVFAQCAGCHSIEPGRNVFGPSLAGLSGRRAGSLPGYDYSLALRDSRIVWNEKTLDLWLRGPGKMVPGTRMPFSGIQDPAARKAVVAYLLSI